MLVWRSARHRSASGTALDVEIVVEGRVAPSHGHGMAAWPVHHQIAELFDRSNSGDHHPSS
jgi:hypothetical protein